MREISPVDPRLAIRPELLYPALVFGVLIVIVSCHQGLSVTRGAVGVGLGTTRAMVFSALALLIFNFFLTLLLNVIFPAGLSA